MKQRVFDGDRCRELRVNAGLTAKDLAEAVSKSGVSVTESAVCRWERKERVPRPGRLFALARALGTTPEQLLVERQADAA